MSEEKPTMMTCVECGKEFSRDPFTGRPKITCSLACHKKRRYQQLLKWRAKTDCPEHMHGTITGYTSYRCDCARCKMANTVYARQRREKLKNS